jgi:SAM-dependent methyltransferase
MIDESPNFEKYFSHLRGISFLGRMYKRFISSRIIFYFASRFGKRIVEIGSGTGSGILGTFPENVIGLDINPMSVNYCQSRGFHAHLIKDDGFFPLENLSIDACVLDNVLEHLEYPKKTLDECYRVTTENGGLVIIVPGTKGYNSDIDHKIFYNEKDLRELDSRWKPIKIFSIPLFFTSSKLSRGFSQYCLIAIYKKI